MPATRMRLLMNDTEPCRTARLPFLSLRERIKVRVSLLRVVPSRFLGIDGVYDRIDHTIEIFEHFVIPKSEEANTAFVNSSSRSRSSACPRWRLCSTAVEFNREFYVRAEKINDSVSDWMLSAKL